MLIRRLGESLAISQPHHAWISGELARAWGNDAFVVPAPRDPVICGTALHDIGWLEWERAPWVDPDTGLPRTFARMPAQTHAPMWRHGVELALPYGPVPALIVARHGESIYGRFFDPSKAPADAVAAVEGFLDWSRAFCAATIARLARDPETAPFVSADHLAFMQAFVAALDAFSLHLCWGVAEPVTVEAPSRAGEMVEMTLAPLNGGSISVDPWPFAARKVQLAIEGRRLERPCGDQAALDAVLAAAPTIAVATSLRPLR